MPKTAEQKTRILALLELLRHETDEDHPMTCEAISVALSRRGITAERKTILDDLHALEEAYHVAHRRGVGGGYYIEEHAFEPAELKMLVDAVQSSRFISHKRSEALIRKLCDLTSSYTARELSRQVYVSGRVKSDNSAVLYSIDAIHRAIAERKKITFRYTRYTLTKEREFRHGGKVYEVSPYVLSWTEENYYLICRDDEAGVIKHFRVDKMRDVTVTDTYMGDADMAEKIDPALYAKETFGMYGGQETTVTLLCDASLTDPVIDRFGEDITLFPTDDGRAFRCMVRVRLSPVFLSWVVGFGAHMRILSPPVAVSALRGLLSEVVSQYDSE